MYLPIEPAPDCVSAWRAALAAVDAKPGHEFHNVIIDVADPTARSRLSDPVVAPPLTPICAERTRRASRPSPIPSSPKLSTTSTVHRSSSKDSKTMCFPGSALRSAGRDITSSG